uniref:Actin-like n=1 Tax=Geotrypetes seraphini TaxID=260995 RepID=A0A6P8S4M3_GEOSA|nr:actin-like [Geotrypetes seraphini]
MSTPCQISLKQSDSDQLINIDKERKKVDQLAVPKELSSAASTSNTDQISAFPIKKTVAVVIDTGTGTTKVGKAGEPKPSSLVSTVVGYPLKKSLKCGNIREPFYIGNIAFAQPDIKIIEPVRHGIIIDWEAMETIWRYIFYHDLKASPEEHAVLLSDPPLSPTTNREKLVEVLFESMKSIAMYVAYQSVLSTYSYGKVSGLVVESGYGVSHTVPVYQGYILPHATERMDIAGTDLTTHLMKLLQENTCKFNEKTRYIVEDIKQKCCYVAFDYEHELSQPENEYLVDYKLPDGQIITIGKERFQCPEILFSPPQMEGLCLDGIHNMAQRSLQKVPEESLKEINENIFLCGGSTLFEGFTERFRKELFQHQSQHKSTVLSVPEREYSTWLGGSILASLTSFQSCWVHAQQYKEHGPHIVYRKCY